MTREDVIAILAALNQVLSILGVLQGDESATAREHVPYAIENDVLLTKALVNSPIFGLAELYAYQQDAINAIQNVRLDTASPHIATVTDVLDAIALLTPVTLPELPPPGYGGSLDASTVWLSNLETYDFCPVD